MPLEFVVLMTIEAAVAAPLVILASEGAAEPVAEYVWFEDMFVKEFNPNVASVSEPVVAL